MKDTKDHTSWQRTGTPRETFSTAESIPLYGQQVETKHVGFDESSAT